MSTRETSRFRILGFVVALLIQGGAIAGTAAIDYSNRGAAKHAKGDFGGAIADSDRALKLEPKYAEAYSNRGNAKADKGDRDGAIAEHKRTT